MSQQFMLGASTAAYQVEGNNRYSDFWTIEQLPHTSFLEPSGDAVDHYNRFEEDIRMLKEAGLNAYRFSIEWARIEQIKGSYNREETEHYREVLACCKENGITPVVTMHHFSSPKWLIEEGGWENEKVVEYFAAYCAYIAGELGDDMEYVCTINEANMRLQMAAIIRMFAKAMGVNLQVGVNLELPEEYQISQREEREAFGGVEAVNTFLSACTPDGDVLIMKAHQAARTAMKKACPHLKVGLTLSLHDIQPAEGGEAYARSQWEEEFTHYLPYLQEDDFIGVQNYTRMLAGKDSELPVPEGAKTTQMGYEFYPQAMGHVVRRVASELKKPILITENGVATSEDKDRVQFIERVLSDLKEMVAEGIPVIGYLHWSLFDNFEWQQGFQKTFGLIAVDRSTQIRTPKPSLYAIARIWNKRSQSHMFVMESTITELLQKEEVRTFLEKMMPQMMQPPASDYIVAMTAAQVREMLPEGQKELMEAVIDIANGKEPTYIPADPHTTPATVSVGRMMEDYNIDDVDGPMYMLDHRFSGCILLQFSKTMKEDHGGSVTYGETECPYEFVSVSAAGGIQILGVFVRDICKEYDREYSLHLEGFVDEDDLTIEPADVRFRTQKQMLPDPAYAEHDEVAFRAASESIVLLKNDNELLPVNAQPIYVSGTEQFRVSAVGAGKINPRYIVRLQTALEQNGFTLSPEAAMAMIVISRASGENYDNNAYAGEYYLSEEEKREIARLTDHYAHVIAVINSGYPMDVRWLQEYGIEAAIWCGFPGMLGAQALSDILCGKVNPSGKLPDTWSCDYWDIPSSANFYQPKTPEEALDADHDIWVDTCYEEDIYVGYRYFETFKKPVAFPFGHGLSYTAFEKNCNESAFIEQRMETVNELKVPVHIKNIGDCSGKDVAALYVSMPDGTLEKPERQLVAFEKTALLQPGEGETVTLVVPMKYLASFEEESSSWVLEAGTYHFYLGGAVSDAALVGKLELLDTRIIRTVGNYCKPNISFERLSKYSGSKPRGEHSGMKVGVHELQPRAERLHINEKNVPDVPEVDSWSLEELARMSVCASAGWGMHQKGEAGKIYRLKDKDIPYFACADGNSGVNVNHSNIGMPCSNLLCASWDKHLAYEVGRVIAEEAKDNDIQMILATAMNIHRNPLCGRHPEYFSEDPLLTGLMAGHQCKGLEDLSISASMKHVVCNNSEASRKRNQSIVSQRALREIYLRAFEIAFDVQKPDTIMTGYNALNGVFAAEDEELLIGIFRNEFGFDGFIMTDWNSYDTVDIPSAVAAGNCWMTPGSEDDTYVKPILQAVKSGELSAYRLRNNIRYLMNIIRYRTNHTN